MNKVILVGRLARDPEIRYTQGGKAVASFTLAVNRQFGRSENNNQPTADFIPIIAWEKLAEICGNNIRKGSQISVVGRMQVRNYDAQDGTKRYVTEVVAKDVEFLGGKPDNRADGQPAGTISHEESGAEQFGPAVPDEEIPF